MIHNHTVRKFTTCISSYDNQKVIMIIFKLKINEKTVRLSHDSNLGPLGQGIYSTENEAFFDFFEKY